MSIIYFISESLRNDQYPAFLSFLEVQSEVSQGQIKASPCFSQPHHNQTLRQKAKCSHGSITNSTF